MPVRIPRARKRCRLTPGGVRPGARPSRVTHAPAAPASDSAAQASITERKPSTNASAIARSATVLSRAPSVGGTSIAPRRSRWLSSTLITAGPMPAPSRFSCRLRSKIGTMITPNAATAIKPATLDTALLMPEAAPTRSVGAALITVVVSGATVTPSPGQVRRLPGRTSASSCHLCREPRTAQTRMRRRSGPTTSGSRAPCAFDKSAQTSATARRAVARAAAVRRPPRSPNSAGPGSSRAERRKSRRRARRTAAASARWPRVNARDRNNCSGTIGRLRRSLDEDERDQCHGTGDEANDDARGAKPTCRRFDQRVDDCTEPCRDQQRAAPSRGDRPHPDCGFRARSATRARARRLPAER